MKTRRRTRTAIHALVGAVCLVAGSLVLPSDSRGDDGAAKPGSQASTDVARRDSTIEPKREDLPAAEDRQVPAGAVLNVRLEDRLASDTSETGERFAVEVFQGLHDAAGVLIPEGSHISGRVTEATMPEKVGGRARLGVEFESLELPDGRVLPINARFSESGHDETLKDAVIIAGGTLGGIILGEAVDEGEGGVIGAILGGLAGLFGAKKIQSEPIVLPQGTELALKLTEPIDLPGDRLAASGGGR